MMQSASRLVLFMLLLGAVVILFEPTAYSADQASAFLGFDRNEYPGDENLAELRKSFSYTGYWLNHPPGAKTNTWTGKRAKLDSAGFGFLVLFNGRLYSELKTLANAGRLGQSDAKSAVAAARREGFPDATIIFLDQEQGGRMLPEQKAYLFTWIDGVAQARFRAGVYCSGIAAKEESGASIVTAEDIRTSAGARQVVCWVTNDACPPSPGCTLPQRPLMPGDSGVKFAEVLAVRAVSQAERCRRSMCGLQSGRELSCAGVEHPGASAGPEHGDVGRPVRWQDSVGLVSKCCLAPERETLGAWRLEDSILRQKATTGAKAPIFQSALRGPEGPLFHGDAYIPEFFVACSSSGSTRYERHG